MYVTLTPTAAKGANSRRKRKKGSRAGKKSGSKRGYIFFSFKFMPAVMTTKCVGSAYFE